MERHFNIKDLVRACLGGMSPGKREKIMRHLEDCARCRRVDDVIKLSLQSSDNSDIAPAPYTLQRIIARAGQTELPVSRMISIRNMIRPLTAAGVIVIIVLSIFLFRISDPEGLKLKLSSIRGDGFINGSRLVAGRDITIETGAGSSAAIDYKDLVKIRVSDNSQILISRAEHDRNNDKYYFEFNLIKGALYSFSSHENVDLEHIVSIHNTRIKSLGTEFAAISDKGKAHVLLSEGRVMLSSSTGEEKMLLPGQKAEVQGAKLNVGPLGPDDRNKISSLARGIIKEPLKGQGSEALQSVNTGSGKNKIIEHGDQTRERSRERRELKSRDMKQELKDIKKTNRENRKALKKEKKEKRKKKRRKIK